VESGSHRCAARCAAGRAASLASATRSSQRRTATALPGRFHPQFRNKNRRDTGQSQSKWTPSKMETPGSPRRAQPTV
jgi:hypothetical protein